MAFTTLILDAPGPPLLFEEVDRFLELGLAVTLNLHYFADKDRIRQHYTTRIEYAEINCHDEPAFIAAVSRAGEHPPRRYPDPRRDFSRAGHTTARHRPGGRRGQPY